MKKFKIKITVLMFLVVLSGIGFIFSTVPKGLISQEGKSPLQEVFNDPKEFPHISSSEDDYVFGWNASLGTIYEDRAIGVAVDSNDNIYVSGFQDLSGSNTNRDMVLVKYNPLGVQQWVQYWGGSNDDLPLNILIDSSDNIYVVGLTKSFGDVDGDAVVIKYNITGHQQWNFTWGGSEYDFAEGIGVDSSNNFYIGGGSQSFADIDGDAFLVKFDENWIEQWNITWGGSDNDETNYLHIDGNDDIYIAGASFSLDPSPGEADAFLNKYNSSGDLQWSESWGGSYGQRALGIATDSLDDVYIVCRTFGHPASSGKGAIVKYNSTGTYQWEEIWGVNGAYNYMYRIIIDSNDELYISGTTSSYGIPSNYDAILFNYNTDGSQNWNKIWAEYEWDLVFDLCMDSQSNIYLAGDTISYSAGQKDMLVLKYNFTRKITIITPENKTYTGPMSGYYPGTFGFENEIDGTSRTDIAYVDSTNNIQSNCFVDIVNNFQGHNKVLRVYDANTAGNAEARNYFTSPQQNGMIEWWWSTPNSGANMIDILFYEGTLGTGVGKLKMENGDFLDMQDSVIQSYVANQWYHHKLIFDTVSDTYDWFIDGVLRVNNGNFVTAVSNIGSLNINADWANVGSCYVDGIGYSWDPGYDIGDNLNKGLFLSYRNTTALGWQAYSLDGATNRTILGNTTIPIPSDGVHNIQVFGNNSVGRIYESNLRYFTTNALAPELSINSPTTNVLLGTSAPDFDLSILAPDLDTTWYSLDGGTTNIPFSGLAGTIDQSEWDKIGNGTATITFYANDTANNIGQTTVLVRKDIIAPIIAIVQPTVAEQFDYTPIFAITISEVNLNEYWYTIDGGTNNYTIISLTGTINQSAWDATLEGPVTIRFYARDEAGNIGTNAVIIAKISPDLPTTPPGIPGYNIITVIGVLCVVTLIILRKKTK